MSRFIKTIAVTGMALALFIQSEGVFKAAELAGQVQDKNNLDGQSQADADKNQLYEKSARATLPMNDSGFKKKVSEEILRDSIVTTDYDSIKSFKDSNYYDTIHIVRYMANSDNQLYYYKTKKISQSSVTRQAYEGSSRALDELSVAEMGVRELVNEEVSPNDFLYDINLDNRSVMGSDDRVQVKDTKAFPYRAIGYINTSFPNKSSMSRATGFLIADRYFVTNSHVVTNDEGSTNAIANDVSVMMGRQQSSYPYGTVKAVSITLTDNYYRNGSREYDYAIIELEKPIGDQVGYFGYEYSTGSHVNKNFTITGYPSDKDHYMVTDTNKVTVDNGKTLNYLIDTNGGSSGGPVYSTSDNIVRCVHAASTSSYNTGVKVYDEVFAEFEKRRNVGSEPTATPKPTATPTATPKPTATPTATPKPTAIPTATPKPTATPDAGKDTYSSTKVYYQGDKVVYKGIEYQAKYWTQGDIPSSSSPVWERLTPEAEGEGANGGPWESSRVYLSGDRVTYNGKKYKAKYWTQGNIPGKTDPWQTY